jgi:hypothetical protein
MNTLNTIFVSIRPKQKPDDVHKFIVELPIDILFCAIRGGLVHDDIISFNQWPWAAEQDIRDYVQKVFPEPKHEEEIAI